MRGKQKEILLIGACGMGVGPLGIFLSGMGHRVFGYDDYPVARIVRRLEASGVTMLEHLNARKEFDEVIVTRAVQHCPDRLLRLRERYQGARLRFRGEFLAELTRDFQTVVVAGTHGKTTTTANLIALLEAARLPFSYILGGYFVNDVLPPARFQGASNLLVIELDESDGTMDAVKPDASLLTNIELDHVDQYPSEALLKQAFRDLIDRTRGKVFLSHRAALTLDLPNDACIAGLKVLPPVPDRNILAENLQLAEAATTWMGVKKAVPAANPLPLVERRQECERIDSSTWIVTDYAHHPGEIEALRDWSERRFKGFRFLWVFQPHRYSRTAALKSAFAQVLAPMHPWILPEYGAFETLIPGGTAADLHASLLSSGSKATFSPTPECLLKSLHLELMETGKESEEGTVVLFVGAGDIPLWRDWCLQGLREAGRHVRDSFDTRWLQFHRNFCGNDGSLVSLGEALRRKTTLNVGGAARFYAEPASVESFQFVVKCAALLRLPLHVLGKGSNLLVADAGVNALVVRLSQACWSGCERLDGVSFRVGAGLSCKRLSRIATEAGVDGFAFLDGIPGSLGGAVWMNAGAMGCEIADRVIELECMDLLGRRMRLSREQLTFVYRSCPTVKDLVVLHITVQGERVKDRAASEQTLLKWREQRRVSQPAESSAGCMFKNPKGDSAGRLIDAAGLKGFRIGGASISQKHANFLVTDKETGSQEVHALLAHAKITVLARFGIELEQEIQCFGSMDDCAQSLTLESATPDVS